MYLWFALLIPLVVVVIQAVWFHHKVKWWEFALPFVASLILVGSFKKLAESYATYDTEFWGGWATEARYYEDWDEWVRKTCTKSVCSGSGENRRCRTKSYDCSYRDYHPPKWVVDDSNGESHLVSQSSYNHFVSLFGHSPVFVDMRRNFYRDDGDMYKVTWPRTDQTIEPVVVSHSYENRVQASRSVFNFPKISDAEAKVAGLFAYPEVSLFDYPSVLGNCGAKTKEANQLLNLYNAKLGRMKELRVWLLCFDKKPIQTGFDQEAYWVGGNKNEFVLTVGLDDDRILWSHPFSWTPVESVKIEIRDKTALQGTFDAVSTVNSMGETLQASFVRKKFREFSYLSAEPPLWATVLTFVVTSLISGAIAAWTVLNDYREVGYHTRKADSFQKKFHQRRV